jgi:hypothetical protein
MSNARCIPLRKSVRNSLPQKGHFKVGLQTKIGILPPNYSLSLGGVFFDLNGAVVTEKLYDGEV